MALSIVFVLPLYLASCATIKVQAPYDSFVCFNSTFDQCLASAQSGQLRALHLASFKKSPGGGYVFDDPDAGKVVKTRDGKYECDFGSVPYHQTLRPEAAGSVVFVSPVLLREIGEQELLLSRVRTTCEQMTQAYGYQLDVLALQDQLSVSQKATALLSAELEDDRSAKDGFGNRSLTPQEIVSYASTKLNVRDALKASQANTVQVGEQLRDMYKTQTIEVEYKKQFEDADLSIELQLRALARNLFVLDRSVNNEVQATSPTNSYYRNGSWVRQGTVVRSGPPARDH